VEAGSGVPEGRAWGLAPKPKPSASARAQDGLEAAEGAVRGWFWVVDTRGGKREGGGPGRTRQEEAGFGA
jgi:hypothetical protein